MKRICKKHGLTDFSEGNRQRCRKCLVDSVQKRRYKIKKLSVEYKGGRCEKCGYNKCIAALEFHHVDFNNKEFNIGLKGYTRSWEKTKQELNKCILLCANCHRELHDQEGFNYNR